MDDNPLPAVRRVVTGHDAAGRAVVTSDEYFTTDHYLHGCATVALIWTGKDLPVDLNDPVDGRERSANLDDHLGQVFRLVDMLPGGVAGTHRTSTIDYGVIISGHIELELDDGVKVLLGPGDIYVQRGTIHSWRNPSDTERCRFFVVLTQAKAYEHQGEPLPEVLI